MALLDSGVLTISQVFVNDTLGNIVERQMLPDYGTDISYLASRAYTISWQG